jgi:hypothetical protein
VHAASNTTTSIGAKARFPIALPKLLVCINRGISIVSAGRRSRVKRMGGGYLREDPSRDAALSRASAVTPVFS